MKLSFLNPMGEKRYKKLKQMKLKQDWNLGSTIKIKVILKYNKNKWYVKEDKRPKASQQIRV